MLRERQYGPACKVGGFLARTSRSFTRRAGKLGSSVRVDEERLLEWPTMYAALDSYDPLLTLTLPYVASSHSARDVAPVEQIKKQDRLASNTAPWNQGGYA